MLLKKEKELRLNKVSKKIYKRLLTGFLDEPWLEDLAHHISHSEEVINSFALDPEDQAF